MEPGTLDLLKVIATTLGPAAIAAFVAYKVARVQVDLEKIRLYDKDRTEAYKRLFAFSRRLRNRTFPLAQEKRNAFVHLMSSEYFGKLDVDSLYFADETAKALDELESRYVCMTNPDLIPEIDPQEEEEFLENRLFQVAEHLAQQVRAAMNVRGVSV